MQSLSKSIKLDESSFSAQPKIVALHRKYKEKDESNIPIMAIE